MVATYPTEVETFKVVGRLVRGIADSGDSGQEPDVLPIVGVEIIFTPDINPPVFRAYNASTPTIIYQESIIATTDDSGYLIIEGETERGVVLPWGGSDNIKPTDWTWNVTIKVGGNFPDRTFSIAGGPGAVVDLASAVRLPANVGEVIAEWVAAVEQMEALQESGEFVYQEQTAQNGNVSISDVGNRNMIVHYLLTGNITITALPSAPVPGQIVTLVLTQDGTGGRTITFPPEVKKSYGLPIPLGGANAVDLVQLMFDGVQWWAILSARQGA